MSLKSDGLRGNGGGGGQWGYGNDEEEGGIAEYRRGGRVRREMGRGNGG